MQMMDFRYTLELAPFTSALRTAMLTAVLVDLAGAFIVDRVLRFVFGASTTSRIAQLR